MHIERIGVEPLMSRQIWLGSTDFFCIERLEKSYKSSTEEQYRAKVFENNLNIIAKHNKLYEEGKTSFTLGVNKFADLVSLQSSYKFHQLFLIYLWMIIKMNYLNVSCEEYLAHEVSIYLKMNLKWWQNILT